MRLSLLSRAALAAPVTPALSDGNTGIDLHLVGLEGREIAWNAALRLEADTLSGAAPCNRFFAANASELPEISFSTLAATRMACPDLAAEDAFFAALSSIRPTDPDQGRLYLTGTEGRLMERARDPGQPCLSCRARR